MNWVLPPWLFRSALARMYARATAAGKGVEARTMITAELQRVTDSILEISEKLPAEVRDASRATILDAQKLSAEIGDLDIAADPADSEGVKRWESFVFSEPLMGAAVRVASLLRQVNESWSVALAAARENLAALALDELVLRPVGKLAGGAPPLFPAMPDPFTLAGIAAFVAAPIVLFRGGKSSGTVAAGLAAAGILATTAGARVYARGGKALP